MSISLLRVISIFYIILPTFIFSVSWFRYSYSLFLLIGFGYLFFLELRKKQNEEVKLSISDFLFLLSFALFWTFCTGVAGLSFQTYDYWAHNAKYYDLIKNEWPVFFPEKERFACYYFGYYLVPALISKSANTLSEFSLFIWSALGLLLGLSWIYILIGKHKVFLILFICLGGVGHTVNVIFSKITSYNIHFPSFLIEVWSTFDQSLWVPNQVIPSIIVVGIFMHDTFVRKKFEESFFPITLLFIWAIFPSVILVLIYGFVFLKQIFQGGFNFSKKNLIRNYILPIILFLPIFIYLISSNGIPISGFIWQFNSVDEILVQHIKGVTLDLVIYYFIYFHFKKEISNIFPAWFIHVVFIVFFFMSFYRIGVMNDWIIRGSIPLVIILSVIILKGLSSYLRSNQLLKIKFHPLIIFFLFLSLISPLSHLKRSLFNNLVTNMLLDNITYFPIPYDKYRNTYCAIKDKFSEREADQYLGKKGSIYEFYLSKGSLNW